MITIPKLGDFKLGTYILGSPSNGNVNLIENVNIVTTTNKTAKNLIEGVVVYRSSKKNFVEYLNIYAKSSKNLQEDVTIYLKNSVDLTESVFINKYGKVDFTESVNIVLSDKKDLVEDIDVFAIGTNLLTESVDINKLTQIDFIEDVNVYYASQTDLTEDVNVAYKNLKNLDEYITIQAVKNSRLDESVSIVYDDSINLTESVQIDIKHVNLKESVDVKSDDLQGILLYEDAQHTKLIPNDTQSFLYDFGNCIEEEKIIPFYIVNGLQKGLTNLWVGISLNSLNNYYGEDMIFLSTDANTWTTQDIRLENLSPASGTQFYIKILPSYGINDNQLNQINFRLYKK